ncbi:MAG: hypothetical protein AMK71_02990 [Nitrospira bacterium SG8_35_4]|nr:MAG: hypothetical protein AMK71_02990 [Nitrospira bacterium SG8_35_4]
MIKRLGFEKVFYHINQLNDFYKRNDNFPVHMTVGLTTYCNHRCVFCYGDYETADPRKNISADTDTFLAAFQEAHEVGLKSISLVGTGEPLLHKDAAKIIRGIKEIGIDVAVYTNGVMVRDEIRDAILDCCTWIRLSCNAKNTDEHNRIHSTRNDFDKIVQNFKELVSLRNSRGRQFPTVGCQFVASKDNYRSMFDAAKLWKNAGLDYFAIKPVYKQDKNVHTSEYIDDYGLAREMMEETTALEDEHFKVYAKYEQFEKVLSVDYRKRYGKCYGHAFSAALLADGGIYLCGNLHSEERYSFGNIYRDGGFKEIWRSERRRKVIEAIDLRGCPARCRNDLLNEILWDLKHPDPQIHPNYL